VHFFSLDDFAGHEIQTILEDGEQTHDEQSHQDGEKADDGQSQGNQSVRPGSIVSNIDQRLDDIEGLGPAEVEGHGGPGSEALYGGDSVGPSSSASEAQYIALLHEMQHRELTPADLQLLMALEQQRAEQARVGGAGGGSSSGWDSIGDHASSSGGGESSWAATCEGGLSSSHGGGKERA
jgi:hypothetical protein